MAELQKVKTEGPVLHSKWYGTTQTEKLNPFFPIKV